MVRSSAVKVFFVTFDFQILRQRIRQQFGQTPVMITRVEDESETIFTRPGFRIEELIRYAYNTPYQPPFPSLEVTMVNPEEGLRFRSEQALVDTGSDGTLVPILYFQEILAPTLTDACIRNHWGEWRQVQLFSVDLKIDRIKLPGILVVGDETGTEVVLGRNVLNRLRLLLDGLH